MPHVFEAITHGIRVRVRPTYLSEHSEPREAKFVWAYSIELQNQSRQTVQLINRHWIITDARGSIEEVKGPGVIGKQPTLHHGERFNYTSFCHLKTDSGFMRGTFEMKLEELLDPSAELGNEKGAPIQLNENSLFLIDIPAFSLDSPFKSNVLN